MGQTTHKRTKPTRDSQAAFVLGMALQCVAADGKAVFADRSQERHLGDWLRLGFPADGFDFWQKEHGEKRQREAWALLLALQELVESQFRRLISSGNIEEGLLRYFQELYRRQLLEVSLRRAGQTLGPKSRKKPREPRPPGPGLSDSPEEDALPLPSRVRRRAAREKVLLRYREQEEKMLARLSGEVQAEESPSDREEDDTTSPDALMNELTKELRAKLKEWLKDGRLQRDWRFHNLTEGESRVFFRALRAIYDGACWHSRRRDSLSDYLTQAEMRSLRRACTKADWMRPFLQDRSERLTELRERMQPDRRPKRLGIGRTFLVLAQEAEEAGLSDVAAGLRAADKRLWGRELTSEERALEDVATRYVKGHRRSVLLGRQPGPLSVAAAVLRDGSPEAFRDFCHWSLCRALLCWPEGTPQPAPPDPSPEQ